MHLKEGEETRGCRAPRPEYIEASAAVCSHRAKVLLTPWEVLQKMFDSYRWKKRFNVSINTPTSNFREI